MYMTRLTAILTRVLRPGQLLKVFLLAGSAPGAVRQKIHSRKFERFSLSGL
jgi:hypothetical protein